MGLASSEEYRGATRISYEKGFGMAMGMVICASGACDFRPDCNVTSSPHGEGLRRALRVNFRGILPELPGGSAPPPGLSATALSEGIRGVVVADATLVGVVVPNATGMAVAPAVVSRPSDAAIVPTASIAASVFDEVWVSVIIALGAVACLTGLVGVLVLLDLVPVFPGASGTALRGGASVGYEEHVDESGTSAAVLARWGRLAGGLRAAPRPSHHHFHHARYAVGGGILTTMQPYATPDDDKKHDYGHRWEGSEFEKIELGPGALVDRPPPRAAATALPPPPSSPSGAIVVPHHALPSPPSPPLDEWSCEALASFVSGFGEGLVDPDGLFQAYADQVRADAFDGGMVCAYESLEAVLDDWGVQDPPHRARLAEALSQHLAELASPAVGSEEGVEAAQVAVQVHVEEHVEEHAWDPEEVSVTVPHMGDGTFYDHDDDHEEEAEEAVQEDRTWGIDLTAIDDGAAVPLERSGESCLECGNEFVVDANFCRGCGATRE